MKFSAWYVFLAIWAVLIIHNIISQTFQVKTISYSEFLGALDKGEIAEVAITQTHIQGKMKTVDSGIEKEQTFSTVRVDDPELTKKLVERGVRFTGVIESTFFRDLFSWIFPILLFVGIWYYVFRRMGAQQGFMTVGRSKAKIYMEEDLKITFNDVAGVDEALEELKETVEFLKEPGKFTRLGAKLPRGVLLVGPPGTGKTLLAKAIAGESGVPFFSISGSEFVEMFVGVGAARVRDLFQQAKTKAPCIIFIDELDALGKARGGMTVGGHDEREQTLNQLLVEMDGFDPTSGVILLAATNRPEILDPALLRPGRFDRQILVDRPDKKGRLDILQVHIKNIKLARNIDLSEVAAMTPGFAGADLANLVNEATLLAVRRGKDEVDMDEFREAIERIVAGLEKKNRLINEEERKIVAYHETGHALVALSVPGAGPVQKITIVPRGVAALGYTLNVPTEERYLMKKSELLDRIAMALGGRAAEEIVFGDISTGAHNDLSKATETARSMVTQYGMDEVLGQVYLEQGSRSPYLGVPGLPEEKKYSEETSREIDKAVHRILDEQYRRAKDIIIRQRSVLDAGAELLLEKEKIEGNELKRLMESRAEAGGDGAR
ncbi:MAG: ATP-dependent zinc metalloprotease FtsH [Nitrospiraceae bacterium]|nr:MAG: ATP-dependent zinc metalloprotease FtsH [Nitrospiraceae bacterium]